MAQEFCSQSTDSLAAQSLPVPLLHEKLLTQFQRNLPGYWRVYWLWFVLAACAASADGFSTWHFMSQGEISDELHPAVRLSSLILGPVGGPLLAKFAQLTLLFCLTVTFRRYAVVLFPVVIFTYTYAAWFNVWGHHLYTPVFVKYFLW